VRKGNSCAAERPDLQPLASPGLQVHRGDRRRPRRADRPRRPHPRPLGGPPVGGPLAVLLGGGLAPGLPRPRP